MAPQHEQQAGPVAVRQRVRVAQRHRAVEMRQRARRVAQLHQHGSQQVAGVEMVGPQRQHARIAGARLLELAQVMMRQALLHHGLD